MLTALIVFIGMGAMLGLLLGWASSAFAVDSDPNVDAIDELLPGGQCGQCGVPGCRQAAEAMVAGDLPADCCPPGGRALAEQIAKILGVSLSLDNTSLPVVAFIDEAKCTGCMRCYKACPFDAIVGANRQMHTVLSQVCTGCRLCEKSCNQNCLNLIEVDSENETWQWPKPRVA